MRYNLLNQVHSHSTTLSLVKAFILFILLLLIPVINFSHLSEPSLISKTILLYSGLILIVLIALCQLLIYGHTKWEFRISKIDISLFILCAYILINRYIFQLTYSFSIRFLDMLALFSVYLVMLNLKNSHFQLITLAIMLSGIVEGVHGFLQLYNYLPSFHTKFSMTGGFFNPGPYGGFLACVLTLSIGTYYLCETSLKNKKENLISNKKGYLRILVSKYIAKIAVVVTLIALPATHSRAAWIAAFIGGLIFIISFKYSFLKSITDRLSIKKKILLFVITTIFLFIGSLAIYHLKKNSADGRLLVWQVTGEVIKKHPIFGVGFDQFQTYYMDAQAKYFEEYIESPFYTLADNTQYAFNELLQYTSENGLIGLLIVLVVMIFVLRLNVLDHAKETKVVSIAVLVAILTFGFFSYPSQIISIKIIGVYCLALLSRIDRNKYVYHLSIGSSYVKIKFHLTKIILSFIGFYTMFFTSRYLINVVDSFEYWTTAQNEHAKGQYDESIITFEKALPVLGKNGKFLMNYGKTLVLNHDTRRGVEVLEDAQQYLNNTVIETALGDAFIQEGNFEMAEIAYRKALFMIPNRFYPRYLLVKLYDLIGQKEKAIEEANYLLDMEIKVPSSAIFEMLVEVKKYLNEQQKFQSDIK